MVVKIMLMEIHENHRCMELNEYTPRKKEETNRRTAEIS